MSKQIKTITAVKIRSGKKYPEPNELYRILQACRLMKWHLGLMCKPSPALSVLGKPLVHVQAAQGRAQTPGCEQGASAASPLLLHSLEPSGTDCAYWSWLLLGMHPTKSCKDKILCHNTGRPQNEIWEWTATGGVHPMSSGWSTEELQGPGCTFRHILSPCKPQNHCKIRKMLPCFVISLCFQL